MKSRLVETFAEMLAKQVPHFDDLILRDYRPTTGAVIIPLRRDVRLLPNKERRKWLIAAGYIKRRAARKTFKLRQKLLFKMDERLAAWLKSLPVKRRRRERKLRRRVSGSWIGKVETGKWETGDSVMVDRVRIKPCDFAG